MLKFKWDATNAASNLRKHGVSFDEAVTVFHDALALTFADTDHYESEARSRTYGLSYIRNAAKKFASSAQERRHAMKKASTKKSDQDIPELKREQLGRGVRGKYFAQFADRSNVAVLDSEIHKAFPTSDAVNEALAGLLAIAREARKLTEKPKRAPRKRTSA